MKQHSRVFLIVVACAFALNPMDAISQTYPSKPILMVVPYAAGSSVDIGARSLAIKLGENLKEPVIIDNRPGNDGALGVNVVKGKPADGYTLLFTRVSPIITASLEDFSIIATPFNETYNGSTISLGLFGPAGMPTSVQDRLKAAVSQSLEQGDLIAIVKKSGLSVSGVLQEQLAAAQEQVREREANAREAEATAHAAMLARSQALAPGAKVAVQTIFKQAFGLFQDGEFGAAERQFLKGLEIDPANPGANFYLAETYARLNKPDMAKKYYHNTVEFGSGSKEAAIAEDRLAK